jgi:hypothetical protein
MAAGLEVASATGLAAGLLAAGLLTAAGDGLAPTAGEGLGLGLTDGAGREMTAVGVAGSGEAPGTGELVTSFVEGIVSGGVLHAATTRLTASSSRQR